MRAACCVLRAAAFLALTAALAPLPTGPLAAQDRTIPLAADGYVRILGSAGSIHVIAWDLDSVRWGGRLAPGQELFGGGSPRMVKVGTTGADGPAELSIRVPRRAKVVIDAGEASVDVSGVTGPVEIGGQSGAIKLVGAPVRLTIETVDGAVTLSGGPFRSSVVRTAGGMITADGLEEEVVLSTVTGAIFADLTRATRGSISSVSGVIRLGASVDPTGNLAIESHGGDILLRLATPPGVEVVATALGGNIENTLSRVVPRPVRGGRGQILETTVGGNGGTVTVTSFKGRVRIEPK